MPEVLRKDSSSQLSISSVTQISFIADEKDGDWVKWTHASINKHFEDRKSTYNLYLEGDERVQQDLNEFAELRVDGPFVLQPHKGLYLLDVEINVLIQTHMDFKELYKNHIAIGTFLKAFTNRICVYKYGDGPFDDSSLFGSYHLKPQLNQTIDINNYGIIHQDTRLTQTTLEGHYQLEIWNP